FLYGRERRVVLIAGVGIDEARSVEFKDRVGVRIEVCAGREGVEIVVFEKIQCRQRVRVDKGDRFQVSSDAFQVPFHDGLGHVDLRWRSQQQKVILIQSPELRVRKR